jgi:CDP-diacylglycerol--serine O-phosphatidyltransferase
MFRDGYLYAGPLLAAAFLLGWLTRPAWAILPFLLALFFLWFFRDPDRAIPADPGAVVSPGDGKVTDVSPVTVGNERRTRISIFLSVFDVHVNRSPIAGVVRDIRYQRGKFLNAMNVASAEHNEQNIVTLEGEGQTAVFKQIAGLLARRIVFYPKVGDRLERGQRVGLIKFGSRVDVLIDSAASLNVKVGDRVRGRQHTCLPAAPGGTGWRWQFLRNGEGALMGTSASRPPRARLSKGMYILPSLFTTANMAAGFYAILEIVHASAVDFGHLDNAAKAIGFAVLFDGLDGRVARMTGTSSDFGKELDSLADVITFGVAPAMLAWAWGFHLMPPVALTEWNIKLTQLGAIACFLFLMAGASRLARFNITSNPQPSNPGRPGKKYFVGMPIPAGAGVIAAVVHFQKGNPLESWYTAITWLAMVAAVGYLMVSTWRFYSFKDIDFSSRHPFRLIILLGALFALIWFFSQKVLFAVALLYTFSGVFWRLQWILRRRRQRPPPTYKEVSQTS